MKERATERPILMCGEMVRAILAGTKTETRRMAGLSNVNRSPYLWKFIRKTEGVYEIVDDLVNVGNTVKSPYGVAGDTLWVREGWSFDADSSFNGEDNWSIGYKAGYGVGSIDLPKSTQAQLGKEECYRLYDRQRGDWRPSLFMPRWASRITLAVKGVTLERLHEITDEGARAEGVADRAEYEKLWKQLNGEESWAVNPWVWVVKFDVKEVRK